MTEKTGNNRNRRRVASAICRVFGIALLVVVIAAVLPVTLPRLFGYQAFNVVSGSMEPEIPVGSIVYVKAADPAEIAEGEVIAFRNGSAVVTHRVTENRQEERSFSTKGDANDLEDLEDVPYTSLIGRVTLHLPFLGRLMALFAGYSGRVFLAALALAGILLNVLAARK